jgi:ribokinase
MFDVITIGSATQDIFIESDFGKILDMRDSFSKSSMLCFEYGAKIEIDKLAFDVGGGAINTGVNFANLGFKTASIVKVGKDLNAKAVLARMKEKNIDDSLVIRSDKNKTGFSVILTSFEGDRTVLAHRGANSKIKKEEISFDVLKNAKWIYIAPLSGDSNLVLDEIAEFAEKNNVSLAINPGTAQIKRGVEDLKKIIETAEILVMNLSEASAITGITPKYENFEVDTFNECLRVIHDKKTLESEKIENQPWILSAAEMLIKLKSYSPKVAIITNGGDGIAAFDGETFYLVPPFPAKVISTLGAGDAFASSFTAGIIKYDWDIENALKLASINAAEVIQSFGAHVGIKNFDELEKIALKNPDYAIMKKSLKEMQSSL